MYFIHKLFAVIKRSDEHCTVDKFQSGHQYFQDSANMLTTAFGLFLSQDYIYIGRIMV